MRVCILDPYCLESENPNKPYDDSTHVTEYLKKLGHTYEFHTIHKQTAVMQVRNLVASGKFDVYLNICDGSWDDETSGIEVIQALERFNVPFTGADSRFYDPTREEMKFVSNAWGVKTPRYVTISDIADISLALNILEFPMIVKHFQSYSSIGLLKDSRVDTPEQLKEQTERMLKDYREVLIEEFIDGREFTVLVAENPDDPKNPIVYPPIEFIFPASDGIQGFKHYDMKWVNFREMNESDIKDPDLENRLKDLSKKVFLGLNGTGFGRCDIRMKDADGELYFLEINPNCGVFYNLEVAGSADFILMKDPKGHVGFMDTILRSAFKRVKKRSKLLISLTKECGFGLYAREEILKGEIIIPYETKTHFLVTKSYMDSKFTPQEKVWFNRYAYPISEDVWTMWSDRPSEWTPLNHSCDPNSWLVGLDLVARKNISRGSEITIDYGTYMTEQMPEFVCKCNSANCRKIIKGNDYLLPVMDVYETHFSPYIAQKRKLYKHDKLNK